MPNTSAPHARAPEAWAEVRAHDQVMRYRRSGTGRIVLLLAADEPEPVWPELGDAIASQSRLIVPELPDGRADIAAWTAGFLEGLGMVGVAVVAAAGCCGPALDLARLDADRVARLVLVPCDEPRECGLDRGSPDAAFEAPVPLLVVPRSLGAAGAVPLVTGFLAVGGGNGSA